MRNQRAFGLIKAIVILLVLFLLAYIVIPSAIKLGRLGWSYLSLKDEMRAIAKFKVMETEEDMRRLVLEKAKKLGIELWEEDIIIDKYPGEKIVIDVYYEKELVFPFYRHRFSFNPVVEEPLK